MAMCEYRGTLSMVVSSPETEAWITKKPLNGSNTTREECFVFSTLLSHTIRRGERPQSRLQCLIFKVSLFCAKQHPPLTTYSPSSGHHFFQSQFLLAKIPVTNVPTSTQRLLTFVAAKMPSDTSATHEEQTNKPAAKVPSKQQEQQSHTRSINQSVEEWLKKLDDLEAQSKGGQGDTTKLVDPAQVNSRRLSLQLREGMEHEDVLDALERGELYTDNVGKH